MADNIVESLFGMQPWQIEQQRYQQMNQSADKYASQDPFQRAAGSMYRAGGMLGGVGASAMGMVDPAVAQAQQQQAMMQGVTPTAKGLRERAMQIQDPRMKFQLEMLARKMEAEEADLALKNAHAQYYQQSGNRTSASAQSQLAAKQAIARNDAMKWALNAGYKGQDLIDFVESQVQKVTDTWNATTGIQQSVPGETALSPSTSVSSNLEITQEQKDAMIQDAASRGDAAAIAKIQGLPVAKTIALPQSKAEVAGAVKLAETVAANNPVALAGGAAAKETGKAGADMNVKQYETALASKSNLQDIQRLEDHLKTSKAITGMGADVFKGIERMKTLLGDKAASGKVSDTEILDVMMGAEVFPLIKSLGIGARGMDTPAERDFMRKVLTGEISLNKDTLLEMARLRRVSAERNIRMWDDRVDSGELDRFYEQTGRRKERIGTQAKQDEMAALPPPSQLTGKTVRDTVTGKRYKSNGTQWVLQ